MGLPKRLVLVAYLLVVLAAYSNAALPSIGEAQQEKLAQFSTQRRRDCASLGMSWLDDYIAFHREEKGKEDASAFT